MNVTREEIRRLVPDTIDEVSFSIFISNLNKLEAEKAEETVWVIESEGPGRVVVAKAIG